MPNRPIFQSKIPDHLLDTASPETRYIMEEMSKSSQATDYLISKLSEHDFKLGQLDSKVSFTNGKIGQAMRDISALKEIDKVDSEIKNDLIFIVKVKRFGSKILLSKWFYIALFIFCFGFYSIVVNPALLQFLFKFV